MEAFLTHIGVNPTDLFAGFAGGLVAALAVAGRRPNVWGIFSSIVIGAGCGGYLGPLVPGWMPGWLGLKAGPGVSFGTGIAGTPLCRLIIYFAQNVRFGSSGLKGDNKNG